MIPVNQSKLYSPDGIHQGNCFAACLASILEVPLWSIPPWEDMFIRDTWQTRLDEWLARFFNLQMVRISGHSVESLPQFYIANGYSSRGVKHSTVYSGGELVHDPHPSKEGIKSVLWTWHFELINQEEAI